MLGLPQEPAGTGRVARYKVWLRSEGVSSCPVVDAPA